ncbi:EAL and HDOD domain-containing protein [Legionella spiritensis]|uniref:Putative Diguanylate phosphodiesterase (EAL domain) n=1 Tax=Legionella spiritensis TaxID=452 RepID=A0A0W0YZE3_LEGSP|nr:HDOD domain-containing protein [Legionella spiritensis]KTD62247.1 putative Diguanylate phosphodiesterase (EAL domain) [Legionella spiritensis]SNV28931.1 putative signal transduction protein [Legionella spiritensis]
MELNSGTLFARQEIFNCSGSVCAYELLYREGNYPTSNLPPGESEQGDRATSFVISHLFTHLNFETILGAHPAFINFTRKHLLEEIPLLLPKNRIVIEILENTLVDNELLTVVAKLAKKGYKFALDDFVYHKELEPLIDMANIIKIDVLNLSKEDVLKQLSHLQHFKGRLLAEKVETRRQFAHCKELGFDLFQGYFFNHPDVILGQKISENKTHLLKLLTEIHNPNIQMQRIEEMILQIPKLSYRILRLSNSAALYAGKKIETLLDAIQQLGLIQIRDWISLILISSLDDVALCLLEKTLIRAKMCQSLARHGGFTNPHLAYTIGMLSYLDAIFNEPMDTLLSKISLSEELNNALLHHEGKLGRVLSEVKYYEQGQFDKLNDSQFTMPHFSSAYMAGIEHCNEILLLIK